MLIGTTQSLSIKRVSPHGLYLTDEEENEVLLPNKFIPENYQLGESMDVFIYKDSEDRLVATTQTPKVEVYQYAYLQVNAVNKVGAFMDWGLEKDLLVPFREQNRPMVNGMWYVIYVYKDLASDRLVGTTKIKKSLQNNIPDLVPGQKVEAMAFEKTDRGIQVIVEGKFRGILYANELYSPIEIGEIIDCYVKNVRTDHLIDLSQQPLGRGKIHSNNDQVMHLLISQNGFLPLSDHSSPEEIKELLNMSKKTFKQCIGALYKKGIIRIQGDGIYLIK